jgi:hypothetical protein
MFQEPFPFPIIRDLKWPGIPNVSFNSIYGTLCLWNCQFHEIGKLLPTLWTGLYSCCPFREMGLSSSWSGLKIKRPSVALQFVYNSGWLTYYVWGFMTTNCYRVGSSAPRPTPNLEDQGISLSLVSPSKPVRHGWPYQQLCCRRHGVHKPPHPATNFSTRWLY